MQLSFPNTQIGKPQQSGGLTVYPLFTNASANLDYVLSEEAIAKGFIEVEEVSDAGTVNTLQVRNKGEMPVLFLEGEELIGAKQNRILNTSVLVSGKSEIQIPVSCVEQGRWSYNSRRFAASSHHSPSRLRHALKRSVSRSIQHTSRHTSDQSRVWQEVESYQTSLGVYSGTKAQADTYAQYGDQVEKVKKEIAYVEGATGMMAAVHGKLIAFELFDRPQTCQKVWSRLLSGWYLDALSEGRKDESAERPEELYEKLSASEWSKAKAVGEGDEFRIKEDTEELQASTLYYDNTLLHSSAILK